MLTLSVILALAALVVSAKAAKLTTVADFGDNPSKISMSIYVADKLAAKPAIIVLVSQPRPQSPHRKPALHH